MAAVNLLPVPNPGNDSNLRTIWENFKKIRNHFQYFNVKDYGAVGDGVTVDTTAIQAAYDAAKANVSAGTGGGIVYFPRGRYLSGPLVFDSQFVSILGDGPTASELVSSGSGTSFVKFTGGSGVGAATPFQAYIQDIKLIQSGAGPWTYFLHLYNMSEFYINRVWVEASETTCDYAFRSESALIYTITNSYFRGAKYDALLIDRISSPPGHAEPNHITIWSCLIKRGSRWGLHYKHGEQFYVENCDFEVNGDTIDVDHGGIYIDDTGVNAGQGPCAIIAKCRWEGTSGVHLRIGRHGFSPGGTVVRDCGASGALYGVYGSISGGEIGAVLMERCAFVGSTTADYSFSSTFSVTAIRCQGITQNFPAGAMLWPIPIGGGQSRMPSDMLAFEVETFSNNATTQAVQNYGPYKLLSNSAATTITTFTNCKDGNELVLLATNGNTTLKHRATGTGVADEFDCPGGTDYTLSTNEVVTLKRFNGHWYVGAACGPGSKYRYEEGSYTATLTCTTSGTISLNSLRETLLYTRIGRQITITGRIDVTSVSSPVGGVQLNLPYAAGATAYQYISQGNVMIENYPNTETFFRITPGSSSAILEYNDAGVSTLANAADFSGNEELNITLTYFA